MTGLILSDVRGQVSPNPIGSLIVLFIILVVTSIVLESLPDAWVSNVTFAIVLAGAFAGYAATITALHRVYTRYKSD